jgi:uncharacterized membrane protein
MDRSGQGYSDSAKPAETAASAESRRYLMLDAMRGLAVSSMIFFHGAFDLNLFRFIRIDIYKDPFWFSLPRLIVSLFLICVGMSLSLVYKDACDWRRLWNRVLVIGGWAAVISAATFILFPRNFIYFGVLHCIAVSSVAGVFFVNRPKLSLFLGLGMILSNAIFAPGFFPVSRWLDVVPIDHVPFYPYFGMVLIGIYLESIHLHQAHLKKSAPVQMLSVLGRHSLTIYLLHQPILYGAVWVLYKMKTGF